MPSTVIRRFDYEDRRNELIIQFQSGRRYAYFNVPPDIYQGLRAARSRGTFFNDCVRNRYPCNRLD